MLTRTIHLTPIKIKTSRNEVPNIISTFVMLTRTIHLTPIKIKTSNERSTNVISTFVMLTRTIHLTPIQMRYGSKGWYVGWSDHPGIFAERLRRTVGQ
jgi:hypothetical protein